jgi:hypothetical protein
MSTTARQAIRAARAQQIGAARRRVAAQRSTEIDTQTVADLDTKRKRVAGAMAMALIKVHAAQSQGQY